VQGGIAQRFAASMEQVGAGLSVLRALPVADLEAVGPFVFLDHIGPVDPPAGGVPAHPHAGIEVITYVIDGENDHRDSFGNQATVQGGGAQWITSGRGMLHAEFPRAGASGRMHAIQLWVRQRPELDEAEPRYVTIPSSMFPQAEVKGGTLRLLAGEMSGFFVTHGPIELSVRAELIHATLNAGGSMTLPLDSAYEMAIYVVSGSVTIEGAELARGDIALLRSAAAITATNSDNSAAAHILLLGGERAERPLYSYGPFVFNSRERIHRAIDDYKDGGMGRLDGVPY
jgi:redox-sensitive bicupin YhaK (pirin superfamily)